MSSFDDTTSEERLDRPRTCVNDEANAFVLAPPHLVQIHAGKAEIDRRIDAWIRNKRQEIDVLNVEDFCLHAGFSGDTCARVDAMRIDHAKPVRKKLRVRVRDTPGTVGSSAAPCTTTEEPTAAPAIKTEEPEPPRVKIEELVPSCVKIEPEEPLLSRVKIEEPVASCSKDQEPVASCSRDQEPVASCSRVPASGDDSVAMRRHTLDERIEERLGNVEKHLKIKRPHPGDVYTRLKDVEDRLLFLEGVSLEYFSDKVLDRESPTEKRTYTVKDIEEKIKTLKAKLK